MTTWSQATGAIPGHGIHEHYPELAAWFVPLSLTTWSAVRHFSYSGYTVR